MNREKTNLIASDLNTIAAERNQWSTSASRLAAPFNLLVLRREYWQRESQLSFPHSL